VEYLLWFTCEHMSKFLSTEINILGYKSESVQLYVLMLTVYTGILIGKHYLDTNIHQFHREALSKVPKDRDMCKLVGFNILRTMVHIVNILFITSNNVGMLTISVLGHALGVYLVYEHQRPDHKHPVRGLLWALKQESKDASTKKDIAELLIILRNKKLTYLGPFKK